jgi:opacity protein-like surface antigen
MLLLCLLELNAQTGQNVGLQPVDSLEMKKYDSILIKRINPEDMFNKKIAKIDSSYFDEKKIRKQLRSSYTDYRQWRFGVNGGIEVIIAPEPVNTPEELLKYKKALKSGARFGADAIFFVSPNIGIGVNYSTFSSSNKIDRISYEIDGNTYEGNRQDNMRIHFAGPAISIRSIPKHNKLYTSCDFTLGYFTYSNNLILNDTTHNLKKDNFGFATSVGVDYMLAKNISMGISLNITAASIKDMGVLNENNSENLSRISIVMTLKTYK